jgi:hypothetical protein
MLERIPQDKEAIRKALVAQIASYRATREITVCPPCQETWRYYIVEQKERKASEGYDYFEVSLRKTKSCPIEAIQASKALKKAKKAVFFGGKEVIL